MESKLTYLEFVGIISTGLPGATQYCCRGACAQGYDKTDSNAEEPGSWPEADKRLLSRHFPTGHVDINVWTHPSDDDLGCFSTKNYKTILLATFYPASCSSPSPLVIFSSGCHRRCNWSSSTCLPSRTPRAESRWGTSNNLFLRTIHQIFHLRKQFLQHIQCGRVQ